jgi:hypothetical protein
MKNKGEATFEILVKIKVRGHYKISPQRIQKNDKKGQGPWEEPNKIHSLGAVMIVGMVEDEMQICCEQNTDDNPKLKSLWI